VAARVPYLDRITGKQIAPVTTGQIYWGAVPFVLIQVLMIALTILFPQMVMHYKGKVVDPGTIEIKVPELPGLSLPPLGAPAAPQGGTAPATPDLSQPPNFGGTPAPQPAAPATPDLSQPPNFGNVPAQPAAPAAPDLSKPPSFN